MQDRMMIAVQVQHIIGIARPAQKLQAQVFAIGLSRLPGQRRAKSRAASTIRPVAR